MENFQQAYNWAGILYLCIQINYEEKYKVIL